MESEVPAEEVAAAPQEGSGAEMTAKKEVPTIEVPAAGKRPRAGPKKEPPPPPEPPQKRPRGRPKKEPPPPEPPQRRPRRPAAPREEEADEAAAMLPPHVLLAQLMAQARQADSESRTGRYRQLVSSWASV